MLAEKARRHLLDYCLFVDPVYKTARHLEFIADKLEAIERGEIKKLMLFVPPRHGKTELASKHFSAWALGKNPNRRIIHASYSAELSTTVSRDVRNKIEDARYQLIFQISTCDDSRDVSNWDIKDRRGGMMASGVGGAMTGYGANVLIIDDPVKNQQEAESETYQDRIYEWYKGVARTRLEPDGVIVLIMARWHQKDLAGRILENEDDWEIINLPALAREDDAIGRKPGKALWPERYDESALLKIRHDIGSRHWAALFDGTPQDPETSIIKRHWIQWYKSVPIEHERFGGIDTATSLKTSADNMAMVDVCKDWEGYLYVDDAFLEKISVYSFAKHVSAQHSAKKYSLIKLESNNAGDAVKQRIDEVGRADDSYPPVTAEATSTDKVIRVNGFAHLIENGTLRFKLGNKRVMDLVEHLIAFDGKGGNIDDDVDALGFAIKAATGGADVLSSTKDFDVFAKG